MGLVETTTSGPKISTRMQVEFQPKTLVILNTKVDKTNFDEGCLCDV